MRTIKLIIGFEGTRYEGWQSQRSGNTLQQIFEKILHRILKEKIPVISSSRTDSGVHARGLVAHFKTKSVLPAERLKRAINFYLPKDVLVYSAKDVDVKFHARYAAKSKIYEYQIWMSTTRPLFEAPFVLWYPHQLNIELMKKAARYFKGHHDFRSFKDNKNIKENTVRHVRRLSVSKEREAIKIRIEADGFLTHMVRIIVGTLIEVGHKKISPTAIPGILKSKDRSKAGPTAKAIGLTLIKVKY